jgi:hypothetical protein
MQIFRYVGALGKLLLHLLKFCCELKGTGIHDTPIQALSHQLYLTLHVVAQT